MEKSGKAATASRFNQVIFCASPLKHTAAAPRTVHCQLVLIVLCGQPCCPYHVFHTASIRFLSAASVCDADAETNQFIPIITVSSC